MTVENPLPMPEVVPPRRSLRRRIFGAVFGKTLLNRVAGKALEAADIVLGSIPIAEVAKEMKEVAEFAIKIKE